MTPTNAQKGLQLVNTALGVAGNFDPTIAAGEEAGQATGAVITAIGKISDAKKRQQFVAAFNTLTLGEQNRLGEKLQAATDDVQKMGILSSALVSTKLNVTAVHSGNINRITLIVVSSIFVIIILSAVIAKNKNQ